MQSSRRSFFQKFITFVGAAAVFPSLLGSSAQAAEERRRPRPGAGGPATPAGAPGGAAAGGTNLPLVKPGEGMAVSVNYVTDKKEVKDAKLKTERQGVKWDEQHCSGCQLYAKQGMKDGQEVGSCQLFAGQLVKGQGWCNSWAKHA